MTRPPRRHVLACDVMQWLDEGLDACMKIAGTILTLTHTLSLAHSR